MEDIWNLLCDPVFWRIRRTYPQPVVEVLLAMYHIPLLHQSLHFPAAVVACILNSVPAC